MDTVTLFGATGMGNRPQATLGGEIGALLGEQPAVTAAGWKQHPTWCMYCVSSFISTIARVSGRKTQSRTAASSKSG